MRTQNAFLTTADPRKGASARSVKQATPFLVSGAVTGVIMVTLAFFIEDAAQSNGTLFAGLIAAATIAVMPIYDINSWPLAKRSLVHFLATLATVLPLLLFSGWFRVPLAIGVFLLFGINGWTIGYLVNRIQEQKRS